MLQKIKNVVSRRIEIFNIINQLQQQIYLKKVEYYQPLHQFPLFNNKKPQRICVDRAEAVYHAIKEWGAGCRILDMGCSLGYFTNYFAERGYQTDGIDFSPNNIHICRLLERLKAGKSEYSVDSLSKEFVARLPVNKYEIGFVFSVMHHITHAKGLSYAQDLIVEMLNKIPVLFIELAIKQEQTNSDWVPSLPDNELELFAKCKNISIKKLGYFSNHLSLVCRPLYMVTLNTLQIEDQSFTIQKRKFTAFKGAQCFDRCYYDAGDNFIKKYNVSTKNDLTLIEKEITTFQALPANEFFPKLISSHKNTHSLKMIFSKMPGENLHDLLASGIELPKLKVFDELIKALAFLFQYGFYHNDVRLWNMNYNGERIYLLDLGLADKEEKESTNLALLWVIFQLHQFHHYNFLYPIKEAPVLTIDLDSGFQDIVTLLQTTNSFAEFLKQYSR